MSFSEIGSGVLVSSGGTVMTAAVLVVERVKQPDVAMSAEDEDVPELFANQILGDDLAAV